MTTRNQHPQPDLMATAVRALTLYSLAEFQTGNASAIRITAKGASFSVSDNGRGHPIDKTVEGTPYLEFVYTHFDYPFESRRDAPIQLQGIGMSLINALCSELELTVKNQNTELALLFESGHLVHSIRKPSTTVETGTTVSGTIASHLYKAECDQESIKKWLIEVLACAPSLKLHFNGTQLQPTQQSAA